MVPVHRRMRRGGGAGGGAPQLLGNSVFWAAAVLFFGQQQWWEGGCFSIFRRGGWTSRGQCPKGGGVLVKSPPSGNSCIRACYLCKILGNQPLRPPNQSVPIRLWSSACMHVCIYIMYVCLYCNLFDVVVLSYLVTMDLTDM